MRILIAEDSPVQLAFLQFLLEGYAEFTVIGAAVDGAEAVEMVARLRPDIVLMDYHMPRMNGVEATREIMQRTPVPIVIASAGLLPNDVALSIEALRCGALAVVVKPTDPAHPYHQKQVAELVQALRLMSEIKVVRRWAQTPKKPEGQSFGAARGKTVKIIALGGSTGAPAVIGNTLAALPADFPVPILVVQHMAHGFMDGFALWLDKTSALQVRIAKSGEEVLPGTVYVAPDDLHMTIGSDRRIQLRIAPPEEGFRPSISYLFRSIAESFGGSGMAVLLTGMGRDGVDGLVKLHRAGGVTVAQDEATCVAFGMPREAIRQNCVDHVLAPDEIAKLIKLNAMGVRPPISGLGH
jgi:two-component system chemotaxis response regulator CheB